MTMDEYRSYVQQHLSPARAQHSFNVAAEATRLARRYGVDPQKAETAGILHDITRETSVQEQLQILNQSGIIESKLERCAPSVLHAQTAALLIPQLFAITDPEIITAVRYHSTGRENMSLLEKILYVADLISAERSFPGVEELRVAAYNSLEQVMLVGLQFTIQDLTGKLRPIHPDTLGVYNQLLCDRVK